jgi:hypothetical protein
MEFSDISRQLPVPGIRVSPDTGQENRDGESGRAGLGLDAGMGIAPSLSDISSLRPAPLFTLPVFQDDPH